MKKNNFAVRMTPAPQNHRGRTDWLVNTYIDSDVALENGFQKEVIQNAAGARDSASWDNWGVDISCVSNNTGKYIVVEDFNTTGLTGENYLTDEIYQMLADGKELGPHERLARFSSEHNSGGNEYGGGLYGVGKVMYAAASDEYSYYFDSLTEDGKYVANRYADGNVNEKAFEGQEAKDFILKFTGLGEKTSTGTRIIITSPKAQIAEAIENGSVVPFIHEAWWRIIEDLPKGASITVNGVPVSFPDEIMNATKKFETSTPDEYMNRHVVKGFGLYVFEDGKNPWTGIRYLRKGMTIGNVDIKNVPQEIDGKFWGYVEVDPKWEDELAQIEDTIHFGVSKGKKNRLAYQDLKNYCNEVFDTCMHDWGYVKNDDSNAPDELTKELNDIADEIQDMFDEIDIEPLEGNDRNRPHFEVKITDVHYPKDGTETVTTDDVISFGMQLKNNYATYRNFKYTLGVENADGVKVIDSGKIRMRARSAAARNLSYKVANNVSKQYAKNSLVLSVKELSSGKEQKKALPYYYDAEKHSYVTSKDVEVSLCEYTMPTKGHRRVNFDESIEGLRWKIENLRNETLNYRLSVAVYYTGDSGCQKIADVATFTGTVLPFEQSTSAYADKVTFDRKTYEQFLSKGKLDIHASLVANADDSVYEKGDRIDDHSFVVFLNMSDKKGKIGSFDPELVDDPKKHERSWRVPGRNRKVVLNIGHPSYKNHSVHSDMQRLYLKEQMMKQLVLLYMDEGKACMFGRDFAYMGAQEAVDKVLDRFETILHRSLA